MKSPRFTELWPWETLLRQRTFYSRRVPGPRKHPSQISPANEPAAMERPLLWHGIAWAYEQLAMYEAAIEAGGPLPEPPGLLVPSARKRSLRSASREQRRAMRYVEMLRSLTRMNEDMMLQCTRAHHELDRAYLAILGREVRQALGEFGVVGSVGEAAPSAPLPRAMGDV